LLARTPTHRSCVALLAALATSTAAADGVQKLDPVEVSAHYDNSVGSSDAASAGVITPRLIDDRPLLRPSEVLEYIPGMIVTQHSGTGKANQYFLRGFNLDHGTDFATYLAGMPVNMRTHAHGQGYTDLNFMIPELVARIDYFKGPYYAAEGDFAVAGGANIHYFDAMKRNLAEVTAGSYGYARALVVGSTDETIGPGRLVYGFEAFHDNGPWEVPQNYRKYNGVLRYTLPVTEGQVSITAMAYEGRWTATDQIAQRAVDQGIVDRFGSLNDSDGGQSHRYSLSLDYLARLWGGRMQTTAYAIRYYLNLYSDFTYYLNNPVDGDQFNQYDNRKVYGWNGSWTQFGNYFGRPMQNSVGWDIRQDRIAPVGLYDTVRRVRTATTREDNVRETSYALYLENQTSWNGWFRSVAGVRAENYHFDLRAVEPDRVFHQRRPRLPQQRRTRRGSDRRSEDPRAHRSGHAAGARHGCGARCAHGNRAATPILPCTLVPQAGFRTGVQRRLEHHRAEPALETHRGRMVEPLHALSLAAARPRPCLDQGAFYRPRSRRQPHP
jgi:hypothetical protein